MTTGSAHQPDHDARTAFGATSRPPGIGRAWIWVFALGLLAAVTAILLPLREHLDKAHVVLAYLLVVLIGSAVGGRVVGLTLSTLAFLAFDYDFLPPYYTLALENPFDWLVVASFFFTSVVAAHLLSRAQSRAELARRRAEEIERLSTLGAETLNAGRAEDALAAIAEVIRSALHVDECTILLPGQPELSAPHSLVAWVSAHGEPAAEHADGTTEVARPGTAGLGSAAGDVGWRGDPDRDVRVILLPLLVRGRSVGVLRVAHSEPIILENEQRQFVDALSYYAALGAERVRLVAEAERAEALRQADQLKNALLTAVSHDLRTPLTSIKALAHDIAHAPARDAGLKAASIEEEADRLNRMVADLLELSQLNAGVLPIHPELNAVDDLLGATLQRVRAILDGREMRITRAATAPLLVGRFDLVHAVRALGNLVENALKYSPPLSTVELSAERADSMLRFSVADHGPGIPPDQRARVFEPFYRVPGTRRDAGGAGLGLAIARRLAEAQGGRVYYDAPASEQGGSVFILELPAADVASDLADAAPDSAHTSAHTDAV